MLFDRNEKRNRRSAFTFVEVLCSLLCLSLLVIAILSVTRFLLQSSMTVRNYALAETHLAAIAETISQDINEGLDILSIDYNDRNSSDPEIKGLNAIKNVKAKIEVYQQDDVFGRPLYLVVVNGTYGTSRDRIETSFLLRGEGR